MAAGASAVAADHGGGHGHGEVHHPYHLVDPSPWPAVGSLGGLLLTGGGVMWMHGVGAGKWICLLGFLTILATMFGWWRDVLKESYRGDHSPVVSRGLRMGMAFFIASEVLFFFAFFWAFFWGALNPPETIATSYPPAGVEHVPAFGIPFLNTLILLLSGATVTWAHHCVREGDNKTGSRALLLTVCLGLLFTSLQVYEYVHAIHEGFTIHSGIFGSSFYMATGFHGFHVMIGTTFLIVCTIRAWNDHLRPEKHVGFEAATWYWHFVDVVWLFLFVWVYWWGGTIQFTTTGAG